MILQALIAQIGQRFQHEKRARVCLWFDPEREFARLLPSLEQHLAGMSSAPFTLLAYDPDRFHGQVWLKHRVHRSLAGLSEQERKDRRFLLYLPLSEDRLDGPDDLGENHLELLEEYRVAGVIWRVGGKRPSLFRFLRQVGVKLPTGPSDQRMLYTGGFDSLLAKYVAKVAEQPPAYWQAQLTPDLVRARLLGDLDQTIIAVAISPDSEWSSLQGHGLCAELLTAVAERYGFSRPVESPRTWIQSFVAVMALTETYLGYHEPADFPFLDRLPPAALRAHYPELLQRWLRDSEGRAAWDQCIREVEKDMDLSAWATQHEGRSFAFPHLVRLRWGHTLDALRDAASKASATEAFFAAHREHIKLEAEYSRASDQPVGAWSLLLRLADFLDACHQAGQDVAAADDAAELVRVYVRNAGLVDQAHIALRRDADEKGLPGVAAIADRYYAGYTNALNGRFFSTFAEQAVADIPKLPSVTRKLEKDLWSGSTRRAVVIVDALRFDCALAIRDALRGLEVTVEPMRAELPTITAVGMTALMPLSSAKLAMEIDGKSVRPRVNGKDCSQRDQRLAFMTDFGADCRDIDDLETLSAAPDDAGNLLVVFGHDQVDHIGHGSGDNLIRHVDLEIQRLARLVRKLHRWGYPVVHLVTDHGFILLEESKLPEEVPCDKDWCHLLKERFALIPATADIPLASFPSAWDPTVRVAVPPGLAFFKAEKSFSHGGAALQELVIPHLVSKSQTQQEKRIGIEVVLPTYELTRTAVKVVLRPTPAAGSAPGQMSLLKETGRTLALDVRRAGSASESVLATPKAKEVRIEADDGEKSVTLFFHTAKSFTKGELLDLDIRDLDTAEQFPPGEIKLSVGRDM
ncbi:MAG: PglZ domain-containing protein [Gammaproteobacteria bacterium]|nr:PglZ domain-containing protein [Gammaproteobacteria bacterium]